MRPQQVPSDTFRDFCGSTNYSVDSCAFACDQPLAYRRLLLLLIILRRTMDSTFPLLLCVSADLDYCAYTNHVRNRLPLLSKGVQQSPLLKSTQMLLFGRATSFLQCHSCKAQVERGLGDEEEKGKNLSNEFRGHNDEQKKGSCCAASSWCATQ